ncbi:MAG: arsenite methyltransferase [Anaerolineales bacterium]
MNVKDQSPEELRSMVRERYGSIAEKTQSGASADCGCGSGCCSDDTAQLESVEKLYADPDVLDLPAEVTDLSLGCGDPITLAALKEGQTVLDLGSGGGIDCFLAAKKVGPRGKVIGVDMTAAMIDRARANKAKLGADNVEFRLGEIEHLPVEDASVDVIISNCVINLSPDKPQVFREAFRVLKPGGRFAVSDIVTQGAVPEAVRDSLNAWAGCVAGAMDVDDFVGAMEAAGFVDVQVQASYWDEDQINAAVEQVEPALVLGTTTTADGQTLWTMEGGEKTYDLQKAVFSARITAHKPE